MRLIPTAILISFCLVGCGSILSAAQTSSPMIVYFYEDGCPSCEQMEQLLEGMTIDSPDTVIARHEIQDPESQHLLMSLAKAYDEDIPTDVPVVFVGDEMIVGMDRANEFALRNVISDCLQSGCESPIARLPISQWRADGPGLAMFLAVFFALAWLQIH